MPAGATHAYYFEAYVGAHPAIDVKAGDCVYWISADRRTAQLEQGPTRVHSKHIATVVRGFMPADRSASLSDATLLPYINACSARQIFAPPRPGDPTLQLLRIPAGSSEQAHHIHSTARVVYVLSGRGVSVVGMPNRSARVELKPGRVCLLDPMCPHHFETPGDEHLVVVPLHVFSSIPSHEKNHPMFNGTHEV